MKQNISRFLPFFTAGAALLSCNSPDNEISGRPNIIIIMTDDQGWGDLSLHGNTNLHTPNIDQLAKNGVRFSNFYVSPVCSPTRAELLTGRYHTRMGVSGTSEGGERFSADETTIADIFSEAGYATGAFGKWHSGTQHPYHPNARGFDEFYGFCSGHWGDYFSPPLEHNGTIVQGDGYVPDDITTRAIEFIGENRKQPFLLYLAQITPHTPLQVPDRWYEKFSDRKLEMHADERFNEDPEFTRAVLAICENIDWNVGRIMYALRDMDLEENTIVVFLHDNGPNSWRWNGGMKGRKGSTDEGGIRSPLLIQWKGTIKPDMVIEEISGAIDLLPTLSSLAGITCNTAYPADGLDLTPLFMEEADTWSDRFIFTHWNGRVSVRNQRYRLDSEGRLFDIGADRGQKNDIKNSEPEISEKMIEAVNVWKTGAMSGIDNSNVPFTVGHPEAVYTQLPARDGQPHGGIVRSNRWPNSSFFTNWTSLNDSITWDIEVPAGGNFEVEIFYTCPPGDQGSSFELSFGSAILEGLISEPHDPPLRGMENDRVKREESYIKDFRPLDIGKIFLNEGTGQLTLKATEIAGSQVMDFRLMVLRKID